jgi:chromosome segregation ATPase
MADFETEWEPFVIEFSGSLQDAERELRNLQGRYDQVCADWHQRQDLRDRHDQTQEQLRREGRTSGDRRLELRRDLARLQSQIEELDQRLESRLLSESSLKDVFWQSVRFGGLGVAIGWALTHWFG